PDGSFGVLWLTPQATEMTEQDWNFPEGRFLSYVLGPLEHADAPLYVVLNAAPETIEFTLPMLPQYSRWTACLDTAPQSRLGVQLSAGEGAGAARVDSGLFGLPMTGRARFGAELNRTGVTFRLWAPGARRVEVMLDRAHPMRAEAQGWYQTTIPHACAGTLYKYRIDGELEVPDPASDFQPQDVIGPSEVIDHDRFEWRMNDWGGRPWEDAAILELHVGTFTPGGTFRTAIDRLDHVVDAGLTAIELMPVADFAGRRNWGYDGVLLYAPDSAYGRPDDLRTLVDEAHARGLMAFLDVVYNHV